MASFATDSWNGSGRRHNKNKSEDLPIKFPLFQAFGWKAIERIVQVHFITSLQKLSCMNNYVGAKSILLILKI